MGINNPSSSGGDMILLYSETLAAAGRFDVSNISQLYTNLLIILMLRSDVVAAGDSVWILFNGDTTAANYRYARHQAGTSELQAVGDESLIAAVPAASATANYFGYIETLVPLYADTSRLKTAKSTYGQRQTATDTFVGNTFVMWESTAAINRVTIQPDGYATDEFDIGSSIQIYGLN